VCGPAARIKGAPQDVHFTHRHRAYPGLRPNRPRRAGRAAADRLWRRRQWGQLAQLRWQRLLLIEQQLVLEQFLVQQQLLLQFVFEQFQLLFLGRPQLLQQQLFVEQLFIE